MRKEDHGPIPHAYATRRRLHAVRVLLVDDNEDHRFLATRAFAALKGELDVELALARDGDDALDQLLGDGAPPLPDLVLLDIKMPGRDGFEVLEALRADARARALRIVMMTSSENAADVARARELGADDYVTKPMDPRAFRESVHALVRRYAAAGEA